MSACRRALVPLIVASSSALAVPHAHAGEAGSYPGKPVRMIVPFPPGGSIDPVARMMTAKFAEAMGQQFIVDNRPGANGAIGTELLAKSPPDGYTLIHLGPGTHVINALLRKDLPYDSMKDFAPVATVQRSDYVLVSHPSLPVGSVKDLVALAKARPGQIAYGSSGNGNMNHLAAELMNITLGIRTLHVPYKGAGGVLTDLVSGQIQLHFSVAISALPLIKAGRLKPLAFGGDARLPQLAQVPTFAEAGIGAITLRPWQGILAPAGTPRPIIDRLNAEAARILKLPDIVESLAVRAMTPLISTPEQFTALMQSDYANSARVIKAAGLQQ
jgi:tripartite-type tricarboxylate transporter receptor subunit TctC